MSDHPAREYLIANLSFNLPQLKDLEYICEQAAAMTGPGTQWHERAQRYRAMFSNRIAEMEAMLQ